MRTLLLALLLTLGSFAAYGQAPDCQFTQTFTSTGYGDTVSNQSVANLGTQCTTWRLSYYADNMTALSIQVEGAPDSAGAPGTFAAVPTTACSSTVQPPCTLDGANPLTDANHATVAFRGYYAWMALHVTTFTPSGTPASITARMYGYKGSSASASNHGTGGGGFTNPMTALGDMIYGDTAGAASRLPGSTSNVPKVLTQTGDGTNSAEPQWSVISSGGLLYYFTPTASNIGSDLQMTASTYSPKTTLGPLAVINGTQTIETWATNAASPGLNFIPAGIYIVHLHYARSPAPIGTIMLQAVIEEVDATGTYIATIGTTDPTSVINPQGGEQEADIAFADSNTYTLTSTTSRVLVLVQAISTSATPTVTLYVGGTADAHLFLPASPSGGGSNYQTVEQSGTPLPQQPALNFTGAGVSCADNSGDARTDCTISGGGGSPLSATMFSSTTTAGPNDSAAETSVIGTVTGSKTIAANTFTNGAVLQVHAQGFFSIPVLSDSLTLKMKCGSTVIGSAVFVLNAAGSITNGSWRFWLDIAARGTGAGGAFITNGLVELTGSALTDSTAQVLNTTTVAYDFTTACVFDVTAQWGAAQAGETIKGTNVAAWFPGAPVTSVYGLTGSISPTAHNQSAALTCAAASASGTAYTCSTSPTFTPAPNDCVLLVADIASGASPTLAVNGAAALGLTKQQNGAALVANDLLANGQVLVCMDAASHWQMQGQSGNAASGAGGNPYLYPSTPVPIIPANWSDFNMTSCTRNDSGNFEELISNAVSSDNICGRTIPFPAGAFTRTLIAMPRLGAVQYSQAGFGITDGTKIGSCSVAWISATAVSTYASKWSNPTTYFGPYSVNSIPIYPINSVVYFRLTDDGAGNLSCQYSVDGTFFWTYWTEKDTVGAGGFMTPTNLLYYVNSGYSNKLSGLTVIGYQ